MSLDINDLEKIFDEAVVPMVITDAMLDEPGPKIIFTNRAFEKMTGYTKDELRDKTPRILQGDKSDRKVLDELKETLQKGEHFHGKTINYRKDGSPYNVEWTITPIYGDDKNIKYFYSIQKDITLESQYNEIVQSIIDKQHDIIVISNGKKLTYVNQRFKEFFDVSSLDEYLLHSNCICDNFIAMRGYYYQKNEDEDWIQSLLELPYEKRRVTMLGLDNTAEAFQVDIDYFSSSKSIVTFSNITHLITEKEEYKNKAYRDSLTRAYSREFLKQNIDEIREKFKSSALGLMLFDIDHFKEVNDTYGHNLGDSVLKKLVKIVSRNLRYEDYLIRWGGEEFIAICSVKNIQELETIAEKLRSKIESASFEKISKLTVSLGITLIKKHENIQESIQRADEALYTSKENGRNRVSCS